MSDKTYIAIQSGGYYGEAAQRAGYMNPGDCAVIEYSQFMKFMNVRSVSQPVFVSRMYGVCVQVAKDLNESASEIDLERHLAEWVTAREAN